MYSSKFIVAVVISLLISHYEIHSEQPGCDVIPEQMEFYKEFYGGNPENPPNFVCNASFKKKLKMCVTVLRSHLMRGVETYYTLTDEAENVTKTCETREVTFWWVNETESRKIEFYKCPITKIRHKIISGFFVPNQTDFYITKGWSKSPKTIFMLRESNTTDNLCVLGEYFWVDS